MQRRILPALGWLLIALASVSASDSFTSKPAKEAYAKYAKAKAGIDVRYEEDLSNLRRKYAGELVEARKQALAANDLDEAQRILTVTKELQAAKGPKRRIRVLAATWGAGNKQLDCTKRVAELLATGKPFMVGGVLGNDPAPSVRKVLQVRVQIEHNVLLLAAYDGSEFALVSEK